jgi:putative transposase
MSTGIFNKFTGYHNRQTIRLAGYDYSKPGYYFITICIHDRKQNLFWDNIPAIVGAGSVGIEPVGADSKPAHLPHIAHCPPNQYAAIVEKTWLDLPNHISNIKLDEFIIMPNHVHGVIQITGDSTRAGLEPAPTGNATVAGLPEIIRQLKTFSAKRINVERKTPGKPIWQRNYYEHIIRNKKSLYFIRQYIRENPLKWIDDSENHIDREIDEFQMTEGCGQ